MKKYLLLFWILGAAACAHFTAVESPDASDDASTQDSGSPDGPGIEPPVQKTYTVSTLAGSEWGFSDGPGLTAMFRRPEGIAVGPDGSLYVADTDNSRIRKIAADGTVSTVAGTNSYGVADGDCTVATF